MRVPLSLAPYLGRVNSSKTTRSRAVSLLLAALLACEPSPPDGTGGVQVEESFGANGQSCGRGLAVAMIDPDSYASVNVGLVGLDGATLSGSFISSASAPSKLNAALSGDVDFPSSRMEGDIVLIDRLVVSVLTFVDVQTADVRDQISVRTGFDSNPQDYVELDNGTALVSRLEMNRSPGAEAHDQGDDLLHIDPDSGALLGRVDLSAFAGDTTGRARPSSMVRTKHHVLVALTRHNSDFTEAGEGGVVVLNAESGEPRDSFVVSGLQNCSGMALSADSRHLALSCGGLVNSSNAARPARSGVVVFELSEDSGELVATERSHLLASEAGLGPFSSQIAFADDDLVLVKTYGALDGADAGRPDRVLALSSDLGDIEVLVESADRAFTLGDVLCVAPCGLCFVADGGRGVLHRYSIAGGAVGSVSQHRIENEIGLPPLLLGWF